MDDARKDAVARRAVVDEATKAYDTFLATSPRRWCDQATMVLNAAGQVFAVHTPRGQRPARRGAVAAHVLEIELDVSPATPQVIGRVSITRGRQGLIMEERPIAPGQAVAALTEDHVSAFLVTEIPKLVMKP